MIYLSVVFVLIFISVYMLFRNNWVYDKQIELVWKGIDKHYLDYYSMYFKFWVWDIEKLKKPKEDIYDTIRKQVKEAKENQIGK